jgi:hypothetical protein
MRTPWILVLAAAGCRSVLGIDEPIDRPDASGAPGFCATWHPQLVEPCSLGAPLPALRLAARAYRYDTSMMDGVLTDGGRVLAAGVLRTLDGAEVAVLSVESLAIDAGAAITVEGRRPLLVVSWSTIEIAGTVDAGSHLGITDAPAHIARTVTFGAGADERCATGLGQPGMDAAASAGSGGGGGGGHHGVGGSGAKGGDAMAVGGGGGAMAAAPTLRGGCPGGDSGAAGPVANLPSTQGTRAEGGSGGGAIHLVAHEAITLAGAGAISASGAGGAGAPLRSACGGGGGGSGGYIGLEAPVVTISGTLSANGGGGGGGGGATTAGNDGADGKADLVAAPGGEPSASCGASGGAGSSSSDLGGASASPGTCGGGGGGGGASGHIVVASPAFTTTGTAKISPAAQPRAP